MVKPSGVKKLLLLLALMISVSMIGCGGGGSSSNPAKPVTVTLENPDIFYHANQVAILHVTNFILTESSYSGDIDGRAITLSRVDDRTMSFITPVINNGIHTLYLSLGGQNISVPFKTSDCINDSYTGLCWDQFSSYPVRYDFYGAADYCTGKGSRVPTIDEYTVFVSRGTMTFDDVPLFRPYRNVLFGRFPLKDPVPTFEALGFDFGGGDALFYWSSTTEKVFEVDYAWEMAFQSSDSAPDTIEIAREWINLNFYVRCVR